MKQWRRYHWIILAGYHAAVFILTLGDIVLGFVLGLLPLVALKRFGRLAYNQMADYIQIKYPDALSTILRDPFGSLYFDTEVKDPEYLEFRNQYKKWIWAQYISISLILAELIYNLVTVRW